MNQVEVKRRQIQFGAYILGCFNVWFIGKNIGDNGIAYLAVAGEAFLIMWILTGSRTADALGRMLRGRYQKGQYKNASKMKRNILLQQGTIGLIGAILFFFLAGFIAEKIFRVPYSRYLMLPIAPVIFIRGISNVFLGYFQGEGSELPTAVSSVLRQVFLFAFGLLFSSMLLRYGQKVSSLLGKEAFTAMYGGIGIAIAILLTEILILLFLFLAYKGSRRTADKRDAEGMKAIDSFLGHIRGLYRHMYGKILFGLLESMMIWMGCILYMKSTADEAAVVSYGVYVGKYLTLCCLAASVGIILVTTICARVAASERKEEHRYAKELFQSGLRILIVFVLFPAVYITMMSEQMSGILAEGSGEILTRMLRSGSLLILSIVLAFYFSRLILLIGKDYIAYVCAATGDIAFIISFIILQKMNGMGIMALVYAGLIGTGAYAAVSCILVCSMLHTGIDWLRTIAVPVGCVCLVGLLFLFLERILTPHLGNIVTVIVCFVLGSLLYGAALTLLRCFRKQELELMPGGQLIRAIRQRLHV